VDSYPQTGECMREIGCVYMCVCVSLYIARFRHIMLTRAQTPTPTTTYTHHAPHPHAHTQTHTHTSIHAYRRTFSSKDGSYSWNTIEEAGEAMLGDGWRWDEDAFWPELAGRYGPHALEYLTYCHAIIFCYAREYAGHLSGSCAIVP
jgi:hypothetical protein